MRKYLTLLLLSTICLATNARQFVHPGILHNNADFERIANFVNDGIEPAIGSYELMINHPLSSSDYKLRGPFAVIGRTDEYSFTKDPCENDFNAAYFNAVRWIVSRDEAHARKAMEIIRAYSPVLRRIHPHDGPLCAGLQGFIIVNAAEILRYTYPADKYRGGWDSRDTELTSEMFRKAFIPVFTEFYRTKAYTNGNWGFSVLKGMIGMAVFLDDEDLFNEYQYTSHLIRFLPPVKYPVEVIVDKVALEFENLKTSFEGEILLDEKPPVFVPKGATDAGKVDKKKDSLQNIIDKVNERFAGDFTDTDRVIVEGIYNMFMKDDEVKKYQQYAKDNNTEMFVDSLFPNKFRDIVTQCYLNNNESFEKLFNDPEFYSKVQDIMAKELYKVLRK